MSHEISPFEENMIRRLTQIVWAIALVVSLNLITEKLVGVNGASWVMEKFTVLGTPEVAQASIIPLVDMIETPSEPTMDDRQLVRRIVNLRSTPFDQLIVSAARVEQVDPDLVRSVIYNESRFRPLAVSPKGAQGLMQLMPGTAQDLGVKNAFDPHQNIRGGTRYLRKMLNRFDGDVRLAVAAYNAGPERIRPCRSDSRRLCIPQNAETPEYVRRVLGTYRELQRTPH